MYFNMRTKRYYAEELWIWSKAEIVNPLAKMSQIYFKDVGIT